MSRKPRPIHTIGHSDLDLERFMDLLERDRVQLAADVRSMPYSRHAPQFNRERLGPGPEPARHRLPPHGRPTGRQARGGPAGWRHCPTPTPIPT